MVYTKTVLLASLLAFGLSPVTGFGHPPGAASTTQASPEALREQIQNKKKAIQELQLEIEEAKNSSHYLHETAEGLTITIAGAAALMLVMTIFSPRKLDPGPQNVVYTTLGVSLAVSATGAVILKLTDTKAEELEDRLSSEWEALDQLEKTLKLAR
ncbi:MAG: hypothetical protein AB1540_05670 [Bdellovibrionota bacterium]